MELSEAVDFVLGRNEPILHDNVLRALIASSSTSSSRGRLYSEVAAVDDARDAQGFDTLLTNDGFRAIAGLQFRMGESDSSRHLSTVDIGLALGNYFQQAGNNLFNSRTKVIRFVHLVLCCASWAKCDGYFIETGAVVKDWLLESEEEIASGGRNPHSIQWYFTLCYALSFYFGFEVIALLPPDGNALALGTRMFRFPEVEFNEAGENYERSIVFRLIIDRSIDVAGRLGDGGANVIGVSVGSYCNSTGGLLSDKTYL